MVYSPLIDISFRPLDDEVDLKSLIDIFPSFAITANGHRNGKGLKKTFNQRRSHTHYAHNCPTPPVVYIGTINPLVNKCKEIPYLAQGLTPIRIHTLALTSNLVG